MTTRVSVWLLVLLLWPAAAWCLDSDICPDTHAWTGSVANHSYGFTFIVPQGLSAYWNSAGCVNDAKEGCTCMSDHGRIMPLGAKPAAVDRQMEMYADFGAEFENGTLSQVVISLKEHAGEDGQRHWRITRNVSYRLGGLRGRWIATRWVDTKTGTTMVKEEVAAFRGRGSVLYRPYLLTPAKDVPLDEPKFRAMLRSFRVTKGEH